LRELAFGECSQRCEAVDKLGRVHAKAQRNKKVGLDCIFDNRAKHNVKEAQQWVKDKWVTAGSMSSASAGVVRNLRGAVGVFEKAAQMRPDVIFLISDASLQWRPDGDSTVDIPYEELEEALKQIQENAQKEVPIQFIAFEPDEEDEDFWKRILRRTGGNFQEMKEK
jgi:hypothetical protein